VEVVLQKLCHVTGYTKLLWLYNVYILHNVTVAALQIWGPRELS